jgi:hypothetical protein
MPNAASILGYGAIGLGFLLAVLAYRLLREGHLNERPIYVFEGFCLALVIIGALLQYSSSAATAADNQSLQSELQKTKETLSAALMRAQSAESGQATARAEIKSLVAAIQVVFPDADKLSASVSSITNLVTQSCSGGPHGDDPLHAGEIRSISADASKRIASAETAIANIVASVPAEFTK